MVKIPVAIEKIGGLHGKNLYFRRVTEVVESEGYITVGIDRFSNNLPLLNPKLADRIFEILNSNEYYLKKRRVDNDLRVAMFKKGETKESKVPIIEIIDGKIATIEFIEAENVKI